MSATPPFALAERGDGHYALQGELSFATAKQALKATARLLKDKKSATELSFDLEGITRTDSAGTALLIEWLRAAEQSGKRLRYARPPENLRAMARVAGVEGLLPFDPADPPN
jgi:phospholipid transport system transporter-binding protein